MNDIEERRKIWKTKFQEEIGRSITSNGYKKIEEMINQGEYDNLDPELY